eukprot:scaffold112662_cov19-Prasinocladus_malaysianus.AAC.1
MIWPGLIGKASRRFLDNVATYIATKPNANCWLQSVGCKIYLICQMGRVVGPLAEIVTQRIHAVCEHGNLELKDICHGRATYNRSNPLK